MKKSLLILISSALVLGACSDKETKVKPASSDTLTEVVSEPSEVKVSKDENDLKRITKLPYMEKYDDDYENYDEFFNNFVDYIGKRVVNLRENITSLEFKEDELIIYGNGPELASLVTFENGQLQDWSKEKFFIKQSAAVFHEVTKLPKLSIVLSPYENGKSLSMSLTRDEINEHFGFDVAADISAVDKINYFIQTDLDTRYAIFNETFVEIN